MPELLKDPVLQEQMIQAINNGKIFVYPTDTVYGLGCDATNDLAVLKLRSIKNAKHALSVIAPSKKWILDNCNVPDESFLDKLPGKITLILEKKKHSLGACSPNEKIGVRIPNHPITKIIQQAGVPFVTTSANVSGQRVVTTIATLPPELYVDYIIDDGEHSPIPSEIWDLTGNKPEKLR